MPIDILMPALSPTMEEGKLSRWLVEEGSAVASGDIIAEIETDKATMDVEAVEEGTIGKLLVSEGTAGIKINTAIATLLEDGESASDAATPAASAQTDSSAVTSPPVPETPSPPEPPAQRPAQTNSETRATSGNRITASPFARKFAATHSLDLSAISGSGPNNRIIKRDVEDALASGRAKTAAAPVPQAGKAEPQDMADEADPPISVGTVVATQSSERKSGSVADEKVMALYEPGAFDIIPHDGMRTVIAERLTYSKQTIPHFRLSLDCEIDELLRARKRMNESSPKDGPHAFRLSVNDFIIKALGLALQQVPEANRTWTDGGMLQHRYSDVGVAVAVEGGLYTPIVRHTELKSLSEISNEIKHLADRARSKRLAPHEYQGGTTSVSNLGMYGIKRFDAVINPPQASILAVGSGEERPVIVDGEIKVAKLMTCTLSCDHRVIDGAVGADLLNAFKTFIDDPVRMLV